MGATVEVSAAMAEWLQSYPWSAFFTATFDNRRRPGVARYARQALGRARKLDNGTQGIGLDCASCPTCDAPPLPRLFVAAEQHHSGDYHLHGLLYHRCFGDHDASVLWDKMFRWWGRSSVEMIRSSEAVSTYCAKYVTKDRVADWELMGEWRRP